MAGSPKKRQRRELAAAAPPPLRAGPTDPATRAAAVARADQVGARLAGSEFNVSPATIRCWRRRQKHANGGTVPAVAGVPAVPVVVAGPMAAPAAVAAGGSVGDMRATQALAQRLAAEAAEQSVRLMAQGNPVGVRELAAGAKMWSSTAASLASAIAIEEASRKRLSEADAQTVADLLTAFCQGVGIPIDHRSSTSLSVRAFMRELLVAAREGGELSGLPGAARASAEVRRHFASELRPEITAALRAQEEAVLEDGEPDDEADPLPEDHLDEGDLPDHDDPLDLHAEGLDDDQDHLPDPDPDDMPADVAVYCSMYRDRALAERELARDRADGRAPARLSEWVGVGRL